MMEPGLETRFQQLIADAPYGPSAYALLQRLSIFLTEKFEWNAIRLVDSWASWHWLETLVQHRLVLDNQDPDPRMWQRKRLFWLDAEVVDFFQPAPTDEERQFAHYAARLFGTRRGIPHKHLDLYVSLVQWALHNKPEIGMTFAQIAAKRYGGSDRRLSEILDDAARQQQRTDIQIGVIRKLALMALQRYAYEAAEAWFAQIIAFDVPPATTEAIHFYLQALKFLGHFAARRQQWAEARRLYERAVSLRQTLFPQRLIHRDLLLCLCHVTRKQSDQAAYKKYNLWVSTQWPSWLLWYKAEIDKHASAPDGLTRQRAMFIERLEWAIGRNFGGGHTLWQWSQLEYEHGNRAEGCALGQLAILELRKEVDMGRRHWWRSVNFDHYSYDTALNTQYLDELETYLSTIGCGEMTQ